MALTLEQYATILDTRDLPWPAAPVVERAKARPHLTRLPEVRAVLWNVYGTLLTIHGGELYFEHPQKLVMDVALDKTLQEFKMWGSMTRKPGQPAEYLKQIYSQVLLEQRGITTGGERYPEISAERVWDAIVKKLLQKDYKFDATFYGSLNELCRKIAYFFHSSLQGTACYTGAATALQHVKNQGFMQGLLADGQCFTTTQLQRGLSAEDPTAQLSELLDSGLVLLSCDVKARKPSERIYRDALEILAKKGIAPAEVLHIGSRVTQDVIPAKKLGMRTALFAGDKNSVQVTPEQLKEAASRPDVLLTELPQIADVVG